MHPYTTVEARESDVVSFLFFYSSTVISDGSRMEALFNRFFGELSSQQEANEFNQGRRSHSHSVPS